MSAPQLPARDFVGYGKNVPKVSWPGNARVALNFVINYEEGGLLEYFKLFAHKKVKTAS